MSRKSCAPRKHAGIRGTRTKTVSQKLRESETLVMFAMAFLMCVMSVSYILQTNSIATRGYDVEQYENDLNRLKEANQNMRNQEAELKSIKNLEAEKGQMVAMDSKDISYVTTLGSAVAMR